MGLDPVTRPLVINHEYEPDRWLAVYADQRGLDAQRRAVQVQVAGNTLNGFTHRGRTAGDHRNGPQDIHALVFRQAHAEGRIVEGLGGIFQQGGQVPEHEKTEVIPLRFRRDMVAGQQR